MKIRNVVSAFVVALFCFSSSVFAQKNVTNKVRSFKTPSHTVCYGVEGDAHVFIPPPGWNGRGNRTQSIDSADIQVTYTGFSAQAKTAFQYAVNIWRSILVTDRTIHIEAVWQPLGTGILGSASPAAFYGNFDGAPKFGVYYPVALAEKIAHKDLNASTDPDITASFSSSFSSWYYGTDGQTPDKQYDLVSVVLHEIGHGLGVFGFYEDVSSSSDFSLGAPGAFDSYIETSTGNNVLSTYAVPSTTLTKQFIGGALFYNSPLILAANNQLRGQLYAPSKFSAGSSIYHLDETKYPQGDKNSLMTPQFNTAEAIHNPGPIVLAMLKDMGWNVIDIDHTKLPNTEDVSSDFIITAKVNPDTTYTAPLNLIYSNDGVNFTTIPMNATATDQYSATLPKPTAPGTVTTYGYYFSATDVVPRTYTAPATSWVAGSSTHDQNYFVFTAGPDTQAPIITHTPISYLAPSATSLALSALITDNIGVQSAVVQYSINGVAQTDLPMTLKSQTGLSIPDSTYTATISLPTLKNGDVIKYRIEATDVAVAQNTSFKPSTDYYTVNVVATSSVQDSYTNNFNSPTNDFFGDNLFNISKASGFSTAAINTTHPYPISDPKDSISYIYELKIPIKINTSNPTIVFDEVVLVEPNDTGTSFGSSGFYDYVVTEGSSDNGVTWKPFLTGYNCRAQSSWLTRWNKSNDGTKYPNSTATGDSTLFVTRTIDMTTTGYFKAGDQVLIRFRLLSDQLTSGWGWAIDNLKIQINAVTGLEKTVDRSYTIYPNPATSGYLMVHAPSSIQNGALSLINIQGQQMLSRPLDLTTDGDQKIFVGDLAEGMYLVRIQSEEGAVTKKVIIRK